MTLLVLNCGSSSIKYKVLDMRTENDYTLLAQGIVERIGLEQGIVTHESLSVPKKSIKSNNRLPTIHWVFKRY